MVVVERERLHEAMRQYPTARASLERWTQAAEQAAWQSLAEVRQVYPHADFVAPWTVFNISGNNFRLITRINYRQHIVSIRAVLTHAEYTKGRWKEGKR
jgi:mRNA interferase HigB